MEIKNKEINPVILMVVFHDILFYVLIYFYFFNVVFALQNPPLFKHPIQLFK